MHHSSQIWSICGAGVDDVPDGRGVLFEVLRVGVNGTDKEMSDAEYGDSLKVMTSW